MKGRAKMCKGGWAPEWFRNAEVALERVLGGLAWGWRGGGAVGALVQGRAKVCKTKWAPEWLRDRVGH